MRLDKYIASVTDLSRKQVRRVVKEGDVTINGLMATDVATAVTTADEVILAGQILRPPGNRYFMLHKPVDVVSATRDRQHLTVIELLDEDNREQLQIVGRLDIDTTGLLLLTDDGQWNHRITSPTQACAKTYLAELAEPLEEKWVARFAKGIFLHEEKQRTRPAELQLLSSHQARLTLYEGRYHQVKRMFAAAGNHVVSLHRERIGNIVLDHDLAPGQYRQLTEQEIGSV